LYITFISKNCIDIKFYIKNTGIQKEKDLSNPNFLNLEKTYTSIFINVLKEIYFLLITFQHFFQENRPDAFYLWPLKRPVGEIWFACQPVGINTLRQVVKNLFQEAGIQGHYTNHSLRATAATRLYESFPEELVAETIGHRSVAVREYERTGQAMKQKASELNHSVV